MAKEKILLTHKLQRKEGQWNRQQKSDLIDSLLRKYPINPTYAIKEGSTLSIIDGVQRLSTVRDFLSGKFALSKTLEPVEINGTIKEIAGKKFNKLDEDTQDTIKNAELQIYEMIDCSEKDVREMFRRQNAGKPLSSKQMRVIYTTDELMEQILALTSHPFFEKLLSDTQRKKATDRDIVIQTLMLMETNDEDDFTSFRSKDMDKFIIMYTEEMDDEKKGKMEILALALDKLEETYPEISINLSSIPMVLYAAYMTLQNEKSFEKFVNSLDNFISTYDENVEYKKFCTNGTTSSENVQGRLNYWNDLIQKL